MLKVGCNASVWETKQLPVSFSSTSYLVYGMYINRNYSADVLPSNCAPKTESSFEVYAQGGTQNFFAIGY